MDAETARLLLGTPAQAGGLFAGAFVRSPWERLAQAYVYAFAFQAGSPSYYANVRWLLNATEGTRSVRLPSGKVDVAMPPACPPPPDKNGTVSSLGRARKLLRECEPWVDFPGGYFQWVKAPDRAKRWSPRFRLRMFEKIQRRLTFPVFIRQLAARDDATLPAFWQSQVGACALGEVHYDFVGTLEALKADASEMSARHSALAPHAADLPGFAPFADSLKDPTAAAPSESSPASERGVWGPGARGRVGFDSKAAEADLAVATGAWRNRSHIWLEPETLGDMLWRRDIEEFAERTVLARDLEMLSQAGVRFARPSKSAKGSKSGGKGRPPKIELSVRARSPAELWRGGPALRASIALPTFSSVRVSPPSASSFAHWGTLLAKVTWGDRENKARLARASMLFASCTLLLFLLSVF
ncbi:hypothetical protein T492DRAFT_900669 [Pavlovales sp. CCMP2436]|nr:hypothetical protein T492DRAFT_900669 [Pavlovales sp. CCMP2436]